MKRKLSIPIVDKWNKKSNPSNPLPEFSKLPAVLLDRKNFLCWKWEWNGKKWTKVPVHGTSTNAYLSFKQAYKIAKKEGLGVGVSLHKGDLVAVDLDDVLNKKGKIKKPFRRILKKVIKTTYCELTPGGTGIRLFYQIDNPEALPTKSVFGKHLEVYWRGRYLTITGVPFQGRKGIILPMGDNLQYLIANLSEKRQTGATGTAGEEVRKPGITVEDAAKQEYIRKNLHRLPRQCFDERDIWKDIGLILHNVFHGDAEGLGLFKMFSAQLPEKFNERDTERVYFSDDPSKPNRYGITRFQEILDEYAGYDDDEDSEDFWPGDIDESGQPSLKPLWGKLVAKNGLTTLYGDSGQGKSMFFVTKILPEIAKKNKKMRFLVLLEDDRTMPFVLKAAFIHNGVTDPEILGQGHCADPDEFYRAIDFLERHPSRCQNLCIVVDALNNVCQIDKRDSQQEFFDRMRRLLFHGASIIIIANSPKYPGPDGRFTVEGYSLVKQKSDVLAQVGREFRENKKDDFHLTVEIDKTRLSDAMAGQFFTWKVNGKIDPRHYNLHDGKKRNKKGNDLKKAYRKVGNSPKNYIEIEAEKRREAMKGGKSIAKLKNNVANDFVFLGYFLDHKTGTKADIIKFVKKNGIEITRQGAYKRIDKLINDGVLIKFKGNLIKYGG